MKGGGSSWCSRIITVVLQGEESFTPVRQPCWNWIRQSKVCVYMCICACVRMFFKCSYVRSICNDSRGLRHRGSQRGEDAFNAPFEIITIIIIKIQPFSFKFNILLVAINYLMSMSALCQTELTCTCWPWVPVWIFGQSVCECCSCFVWWHWFDESEINI